MVKIRTLFSLWQLLFRMFFLTELVLHLLLLELWHLLPLDGNCKTFAGLHTQMETKQGSRLGNYLVLYAIKKFTIWFLVVVLFNQ